MLLALVPGCMMVPMGAYRDPKSVGAGEVGVGVGSSVMPVLGGDLGSVDDMLMWSADGWVTFPHRTGRDIRLRLSCRTFFEPHKDDKIRWVVPGLSVESKFADEEGDMAFLLGGAMSAGFGQTLLAVAPDLWIGGAFAAGETDSTRLVLVIRAEPAVAGALGGLLSVSLGVNFPLGAGSALRAEVSSQCMALWSYVPDGELEYIGSLCAAGGGIGLEL